MLRPSYNQLIKKVNENFQTEDPVVTSRYSIVLAAAKRARQLVDGNEPHVDGDVRKPLSVAVEELNEGKVKILPSSDFSEEQSSDEEQEAAKADDHAEEKAESDDDQAGETADPQNEEESVAGDAEAFAAVETDKIQA